MNENNIPVQTEPSGTEKKKGSISVGIICILLGIILFITGLILYRTFGSKNRYNVKDMNENFIASDVRELDLDIEWADLTIGKSEDDNIYINAKDVPESFHASVSGNTFKIGFGKKKVNFVPFSTFLGDDRIDPVITLQLPEKVYSSLMLDLGAGKTDISGLSCGSLDINCGAGKVTFSDISCDNGIIDCGAGEVDINNIICEGLLDIDGGAGKISVNGVLGGIDIDQGVGDFEFTGTMNGNINADGGVGSMTFRLTNPPEDFYKEGGKYRIDVDTGVGSSNIYYNQG